MTRSAVSHTAPIRSLVHHVVLFDENRDFSMAMDTKSKTRFAEAC